MENPSITPNNMHHFTYKTTNLVNGYYYIGKRSTKDIKNEYLGSGLVLNNAIKKYGKENFKREILEFFETEEEAYAAEARLVDPDDPMCYNIAAGGNGFQSGEKHNFYGKKFSSEHRKNISEGLKGSKLTSEHKKNISKGRKIWYTNHPEHLEKMSKEKSGKPIHSTEYKKKLSEAMKGEKNHFFGKKHSTETRKKISEAKKGVKLSPETRKRMSEAKKGVKLSPEHRKKISESKKGQRYRKTA